MSRWETVCGVCSCGEAGLEAQPFIYFFTFSFIFFIIIFLNSGHHGQSFFSSCALISSFVNLGTWTHCFWIVELFKK